MAQMVSRAGVRSATSGVITVADLLTRHPAGTPARSTAGDGRPEVSVGSLLRREGRAPHAVDRPLQPRGHQQVGHQQVGEPDEAGSKLVRRSAVAAGTLLAAGSVFGAAVLTDASGRSDQFGLGGPYPGQGRLDGTDAPLAGLPGLAIDPSALTGPLDAGVGPPMAWVPVAFPSAAGAGLVFPRAAGASGPRAGSSAAGTAGSGAARVSGPVAGSPSGIGSPGLSGPVGGTAAISNPSGANPGGASPSGANPGGASPSGPSSGGSSSGGSSPSGPGLGTSGPSSPIPGLPLPGRPDPGPSSPGGAATPPSGGLGQVVSDTGQGLANTLPAPVGGSVQGATRAVGETLGATTNALRAAPVAVAAPVTSTVTAAAPVVSTVKAVAPAAAAPSPRESAAQGPATSAVPGVLGGVGRVLGL